MCSHSWFPTCEILLGTAGIGSLNIFHLSAWLRGCTTCAVLKPCWAFICHKIFKKHLRCSVSEHFEFHECNMHTLPVSNISSLHCERILIDLGASWNTSSPNWMVDTLCLSKFTRKATHPESVAKTCPYSTPKFSKLDWLKYSNLLEIFFWM